MTRSCFKVKFDNNRVQILKDGKVYVTGYTCGDLYKVTFNLRKKTDVSALMKKILEMKNLSDGINGLAILITDFYVLS